MITHGFEFNFPLIHDYMIMQYTLKPNLSIG